MKKRNNLLDICLMQWPINNLCGRFGYYMECSDPGQLYRSRLFEGNDLQGQSNLICVRMKLLIDSLLSCKQTKKCFKQGRQGVSGTGTTEWGKNLLKITFCVNLQRVQTSHIIFQTAPIESTILLYYTTSHNNESNYWFT